MIKKIKLDIATDTDEELLEILASYNERNISYRIIHTPDRSRNWCEIELCGEEQVLESVVDELYNDQEYYNEFVENHTHQKVIVNRYNGVEAIEIIEVLSYLTNEGFTYKILGSNDNPNWPDIEIYGESQALEKCVNAMQDDPTYYKNHV